MPPHVPDAQLELEAVPHQDAPWQDVVAFGHRYHAYKVAGSVQRIARLTVDAHEAWADDGTLPETLGRLRLALFHTVRATHGQQPSGDTERWARALVAAVRQRLAEHAAADQTTAPRADG